MLLLKSLPWKHLRYYLWLAYIDLLSQVYIESTLRFDPGLIRADL